MRDALAVTEKRCSGLPIRTDEKRWELHMLQL
jgi:hypothetical protein